MDSLKQIWGTVKQLFYCFDLLDHSSTEYVLCTVCVHLLHRCRWMTYRYGFVLYSDIDLYSLWGIGRNVVILQKGFAVHQLWHFDIFSTKHFATQTKVLSGFEMGLHAFVQMVSSCRHNFTCSAVKICWKGKKKCRVWKLLPRTMVWDFYASVPLSVWILYFVSLLPLAAEVDNSASRVKWLMACPGQRSFYSQGPCLKPYGCGAMYMKPKNHVWKEIASWTQQVRIPTGWRQTSWLSGSMAEELKSGLPINNSSHPASSQSGNWTGGNCVEIQHPKPLGCLQHTCCVDYIQHNLSFNQKYNHVAHVNTPFMQL